MASPSASRPSFPGYGIHAEETGMLDWEWALDRLAGSRNYWISTTRADGRPHAMPVWGVVVEGELWFGTSPSSQKGRNLARSGELVAHTESGDECVILEGTVETRDVTTGMLDLYEAKYDYRPDSAQMHVVRPRRAFAWRESDYPSSATRFDFG